MSGIRIIAGTLKGRMIPFSNKKYGNADITPQRMKEAFFSIVETMEGRVFLDLFSCSGQMGIEALSRGASLVVMAEKDRRRWEFIRETVAQLGQANRSMVLNVSAHSAVGLLREKGIAVDVVFVDPPYPKGKEATIYASLLDCIAAGGIVKSGGMIALQHDSGCAVPHEGRDFRMSDERIYGSNSLSIYERQVATEQ